MKIAIFAAVAENNVIGSDGGMPWRLSTDLKRFKNQTIGKPLVMGRKTWESFPRRPLPGRENIVVTRNADFQEEGAIRAGSLQEALDIARAAGHERPEADEICVIGGGEIYRQAIELAERLYITHVEAAMDGDTEFPPISPAIWYAASYEAFPAGEKDDHPTRHVIYERR